MADVKLVVQAVDRASQVFAGVKDNLSRLDKTARETSSGSGGMVSLTEAFGKFTRVAGAVGAVATTVGIAIKKAVDMGREGAAVLQTAESFETLRRKIGAMPSLLEELRIASRYTVDDMTLMSSTATLLAGAQGELATALAQSTPRLMEIAKAASKLNPLLGDTTFMYESLALGVKRASPMILDNLGLTIRVGEANEEMARKVGKSVEQLTAEEQKMALLNATLAAGDVLIKQVGGDTSATGDAFKQYDARVKNLTDRMKLGFIPAGEKVIDVMTWILDVVEGSNPKLEKTAAIFATGSTEANTYVSNIKRMADGTIYATRMIDGEAVAVKIVNGEMRNVVTEAIIPMDKAEWLLWNTTIDVKSAMFDTIPALRDMSSGIVDVKSGALGAIPALRGIIDRSAEIRSELDSLNEPAESAQAAIKAIGESASTAIPQMHAYSKEILFNKAAAGLDAEAALELATYMGMVDEQTSTMLEKLPELTRKYDKNRDGVIDASEATWEYYMAVSALSAQISGLKDKTVNVYVRVHAPSGGYFPGSGRGSTGGYGGEGGGSTAEYASGGDFIVPPGYPDYRPGMPIGVHSGERVIVIPKQGVTNNFTMNVSSSGGSGAAMADFRLMQALAGGI